MYKETEFETHIQRKFTITRHDDGGGHIRIEDTIDGEHIMAALKEEHVQKIIEAFSAEVDVPGPAILDDEDADADVDQLIAVIEAAVGLIEADCPESAKAALEAVL